MKVYGFAYCHARLAQAAKLTPEAWADVSGRPGEIREPIDTGQQGLG